MTVDETSGTPSLEVDVGGTPKAAEYASSSGDNTALAFTYTVEEGDEDTDGIAIAAGTLALNGGTINSGTTPATLTHAAVAADASHKVDGVRPTITKAETSTDGTQVILTFNEAIASVISNQLNIVVNGAPIGAVPTVNVSDKIVTLTYPSAFAVQYGQTVTLTDSGGTVRAFTDNAGNGNGLILSHPVTNKVPEPPALVTGVAITSDPGTDNNYATGDAIEITVTFDKAVDVTGSPRIQFKLLGGIFSGRRWAEYARDSGTTDPVFSYTVQATDESLPTGISISSNKLELNGGTIKRAGTDAVLTHDLIFADANHRVNWALPTLDKAETSADGAKIILTFSETLATTNPPALSTFTVKVDGAAVTLTGSPAVSGSTVTLTPQDPVVAAQTVTVSYTNPGSVGFNIDLRDLVDNKVDSFTDATVTNRVPLPPTIQSVTFISDPGIPGDREHPGQPGRRHLHHRPRGQGAGYVRPCGGRDRDAAA